MLGESRGRKAVGQQAVCPLGTLPNSGSCLRSIDAVDRARLIAEAFQPLLDLPHER